MAKVLLVPNGYRLFPKQVRSIITCKTNDVEPIHTLGSSLIFRYYIFSIVSTIYCVCYFLFALYFVFLFCIFHHFHRFSKNFTDKMTTLYFNSTSHLLRRTSQKTAWFEIISSIGLIGLNGLIYPNQLICKLKNTINS